MTKPVGNTAAAMLIVLALPAFADALTYKRGDIELEIVKGDFQHAKAPRQMVTVINHSRMAIKFIKVDCGFFRGDLLVEANFALVENLDPGQSGYAEVTGWLPSIDRADCRISEAHPN